ncbi:hypothetical protein KC963_00195 [Candidatus Saccharibacteria bacterium]|nr:hypothetical protein [Candidatus Saccharibacteria bacterium]MCA9337289.1 hypothetical protein [Candidatus Saccharibacteria bacterium]
MIQFNLLPDVKIEYIHAERVKRSVILVASIVAGVAFAIFLMLFISVNFLQKQHLNNLNKDIARDTAQLQAIPDIDKILTVQNQLNSLTSLHEAVPATSRLMPYLGQVTPAQASISDVEVDFTANTMKISGSTDSLVTVNKFIDTLKFTTYTTNLDSEPKNAFTNVVLSSFAVDEDSVTYQISLQFDPQIFNNTVQVTLNVPKTVTTRSETEKPSDLFQAPTQTNGTGQ